MTRLTLKNKKKGFTLVELLVAISIFGVISVLMSNIILDISRFSFQNERRSDMLTQLDNLANIVKNDLRGAEAIGICDNILYKEVKRDSDAPVERYGLYVNNKEIYWRAMIGCAYSTKSVVEPEKISSKDNFIINQVEYAKADDGGAVEANTLVYARITICDAEVIPANRRIFDCDLNPYKYVFSIASRNFNN